MHTEHVLVVPKEEFTKRGAFQGFFPHAAPHDVGGYLTCHPDEPSIAHFMGRSFAEENEGFLQIIPYCLLVCGQDIFLYSRNKKGGEDRLHEKFSVGVGGHINAEDTDADPPDTYMAYLNGTLRELREEVGLDIPLLALRSTVLGLLYDDSTPVGRVHLGVVHAIHITPEDARSVLARAEDTMSEPCFTSISELIAEQVTFKKLEPWSQHALTHLVSLMNKPKPWELPAVRERLHLLAIAGAEIARSASELLMQDSGRCWMVGRENVEQAVGSLTVILSGLTTHKDLDNGSIAEKGREAYEGFKKNSKHQAWQ